MLRVSRSLRASQRLGDSQMLRDLGLIGYFECRVNEYKWNVYELKNRNRQSRTIFSDL